MAIKTRKISDWLSANGQAVTNASLNTMKPYLEKNMAQLYDGVFIMYHRANDGYPLMVAPAQWPSLEAGGEIADGVVIFEGGRHLLSLQHRQMRYHGRAQRYRQNFLTTATTTLLLLRLPGITDSLPCWILMAGSIRMPPSKHRPIRT